MRIRSSKLFSYIQKDNLNSFVREVEKKPSLFCSMHKHNTIFHHVLTKATGEFICRAVRILKEKKVEISKIPNYLYTLTSFLQRIPQVPLSYTRLDLVFMDVLELFHSDDIFGHLLRIVQMIQEPSDWRKLIGILNEFGVQHLLLLELEVPLSHRAAYLILEKFPDLSPRLKLFLSSQTLRGSILDEMTIDELDSIKDIDLLKTFCSMETTEEAMTSEWYYYKELLYRKLMSSSHFKDLCDIIRNYALKPDSNPVYLNTIFEIDCEYNVVYTEEQYITAAIKSTLPYYVRAYAKGWLKYYGCSTSMMIKRSVLVDKVKLKEKISPILLYNVYDENDEILEEKSAEKGNEMLDVGVILLKGYIQNDELLKLLLLWNHVDLTVYSSAAQAIDKITCYDENPLFHSPGLVNLLLILNQIPFGSWYMTTTKKLWGTTYIQEFYDSPLQTLLPSHNLEYFNECYSYFLKRDFSKFDKSRELMIRFASIIVILFDNLPMMIPGKYKYVPVDSRNDNHASYYGYDSRVVILKKLIQKGCDASFMGKLFHDYQSYFYATKLDMLTELRDKIASYLDFRIIFRSKEFNADSNRSLRKIYIRFINYWSSSST